MQHEKAARVIPVKPGWPLVKRVATWLFLLLVVALIASQARRFHWHAVLESIREIPPAMLIAAAGLSAASYLLYSCFDLLGRHLTGHRIAIGKVMGITFISYAFNLNLGSLIGGIAFRYRLYARLGLPAPTVTRVLGFSMLTNWLGYLLLAGLLFCFRPLALPPDWRIDSSGLHILGMALLALGLGYLLACAIAERWHRRWTWRGRSFDPPSLRLAALQLLLASANWSLIGAVLWCLLQQRLPYTEVLSVFLVAAVAGLISHVPGGLGVLEAVFLALLSHRLAPDTLLGALLAYRAIYYLAPLLIAILADLALELQSRKRSVGSAA